MKNIIKKFLLLILSIPLAGLIVWFIDKEKSKPAKVEEIADPDGYYIDVPQEELILEEVEEVEE